MKTIILRNFTILIREILAGWVFLPLMDVLADPNIINWLVVYSVNYKPKSSRGTSKNVKSVEFLYNFETEKSTKKSSFYIGLNKIKSNTQLLYAFMQFLKKKEHVHLLQFCLDVGKLFKSIIYCSTNCEQKFLDEFNTHLLKPDLSKAQLEKLHNDATKLYNEYLNEGSVNFISCTPDICAEFSGLIKEGVHNIAKLRTSTPLFSAYEHTFNVLENTWLPQFFHSSEV